GRRDAVVRTAAALAAAELGLVADVARRAAHRGRRLEDVVGTLSGLTVASLGGVAVALGLAADETLVAQRVFRTGEAGAVAHVRDVARADRFAADRAALLRSRTVLGAADVCTGIAALALVELTVAAARGHRARGRRDDRRRAEHLGVDADDRRRIA